MRLYVNIDHVATIREARKTDEPDPTGAAFLAELGGADGITVHLREDRRHIGDRDLRVLRETVRTGINLEIATDPEVVAIAAEVRPLQVTLVPERREEVTTEGGLNLEDPATRRGVARAAEQLAGEGVRVSLFIDPTESVLRECHAIGVHAIEFHTGEYANARGDRDKAFQLDRLHQACIYARGLGLAVHAGHGLTYANVTPVAAIPEIEELNIGHSIVSRAVMVGMVEAVSSMRRILMEARRKVESPGTWVPPIGF
jgi:pyridoxine 5-phosphate synthase